MRDRLCSEDNLENHEDDLLLLSLRRYFMRQDLPPVGSTSGLQAAAVRQLEGFGLGLGVSDGRVGEGQDLLWHGGALFRQGHQAFLHRAWGTLLRQQTQGSLGFPSHAPTLFSGCSQAEGLFIHVPSCAPKNTRLTEGPTEYPEGPFLVMPRYGVVPRHHHRCRDPGRAWGRLLWRQIQGRQACPRTIRLRRL